MGMSQGKVRMSTGSLKFQKLKATKKKIQKGVNKRTEQ